MTAAGQEPRSLSARTSFRSSRSRTGSAAASGSLEEAAAAVSAGRALPSADVLTRPAFKAFLVPAAASILGPAEIAYHAQALALFPLFDLRSPVLLPRTHVVPTGPAERRALKALGLSPADVLAGPRRRRSRSRPAGGRGASRRSPGTSRPAGRGSSRGLTEPRSDSFGRARNHAPQGRVSDRAAHGTHPQGRRKAGGRGPRREGFGSRRCCARRAPADRLYPRSSGCSRTEAALADDSRRGAARSKAPWSST